MTESNIKMAKDTLKLFVGDAEAAVSYPFGYCINLKAPVNVDGITLREGMQLAFRQSTVSCNGTEYSGDLTFFAGADGNVLLKVDTGLVSFGAANDGLATQFGPYSGSVGPFNYEITVNLDFENPLNSKFYVKLTFMGVTLLNVQLDANNPTVGIDLSVAGIGVEGTVGVDFASCRVYAAITLKAFIYTKRYEFDIYNWGNCCICDVADDALMASNDCSGSILVRNTGGYVARFSVTYTLDGKEYKQESGEFTAGVNKSIEIPAGATNVNLKVEDAWFICSWSTIFTKHFDSPVAKQYHIYGTTLNPGWEEM